MSTIYSKPITSKLSRLKIANFTEPVEIKFYWMTAVSSKNKHELISVDLHQHAFFETHYILKGSMEYKDQDGNIYSVPAGTSIILPPFKKHIVSDISSDMVRVSFAFVPEKNGELYNALLSAQIKCFEINTNMKSAINRIFKEAEINDIFSQSVLQNSVFDIICESSRAVCAHTIKGNEEISLGDELIVNRAKQYIIDNFEKKLTCGEIAENCHFNVKYLGRIFKKQTGMTLLEFIHQEKVKRAQILLADSNASLKNISEQLVFTSECYFNSFFTRIIGVSPGQYRKFGK